MRRQAGFFDVDDRLKRLSDLGDQLEAFRGAVDFEIFRADLTKALAYSDGAQGGRPPFDPVMMFKVLVIQAANNLSDERTEFLINDHLSFMRFLGLGLSDRVPDARTIWLFREKLTKAGVIKALFDRKRYANALSLGAPAAGYASGRYLVGIQNWRISSTTAGISRHASWANDGVPGPRRSGARTGWPERSTQWKRIGSKSPCSMMFGFIKRDHVSSRSFMTA